MSFICPSGDECAKDLWDNYANSTTIENRNALVLAHLWIVRSVLAKMGWSEELYSSGVIGLIDAIERYKPEKGHFHNFAYLRVRGGVKDGAREMDWLSRGARDSIRLYTSSRDKLTNDLQRTPSETEIQAHISESVDPENRVGNTHRLPHRIKSALNFAASHFEPVEWNQQMSISDHSERYEKIEKVGRLLDALDERSQTVVWLHVVEGLNQGEIGEILGVSGSRISQIYGQAIQTMREHA